MNAYKKITLACMVLVTATIVDAVYVGPPQQQMGSAIDRVDVQKVQDILKESTFDISTQIAPNQTPLTYAIWHMVYDTSVLKNPEKEARMLSIIDVLLKAGAKITVDDWIFAGRSPSLALVKKLQGPDVNIKDNFDNTILIEALGRFGNKNLENRDIIKYLLDQKAEVNIKNKVGGTPIILAIWNFYGGDQADKNLKDKQLQVIDLLLQAGATIDDKVRQEVDKPFEGDPSTSVSQEQKDAVQALINKYAKKK